MERRQKAGDTVILIAEETGVSRKQLYKHFSQGHVKKAELAARTAARAQALAVPEQTPEDDSPVKNAVAGYLGQANSILMNVTTLFDEAIASGQPGLALAAAQKQMNAVARCKELVELAAKVSGELEQKSFNLYVLPQWRDVVVFLVNVLTPYPEARQAVIEGLKAKVRKANAELPELEDARPVEAEIVQ